MESRRALVVTGDEELLDDLVRLAAAAGVELTVAIDTLSAGDDWIRAPLVLVGADRAADVVRHAPPRRLGVVLVVSRGDPMPAWSLVESLHAEHILLLPAAETWLVDRLAATAAPVDGPAGPAPVVAVLGGSIGAGASTLSVALAVAARRRGLKTLLVDGDPHGRGIDASLGASLSIDGSAESTAAIPGALAADAAAVDARTGTLAVLTFGARPDPVPPEAMAAALQAGRRGRDLVVVDLPRSFDDASLLALTCADRGLLVVVAEFRASAAAKPVAVAARRHCPALGLLVRAVARRGLRPREVAEALNLPIVGVLPPPPRAARFAPPGRPDAEAGPSPLPRLCRRLLNELLPPPEPAPPGSAEPAAPAGVGTVWR